MSEVKKKSTKKVENKIEEKPVVKKYKAITSVNYNHKIIKPGEEFEIVEDHIVKQLKQVGAIE